MLADICFQLGFNESSSTIGNSTGSAGVLDTAEVTNNGLLYQGQIGNIQTRKPVLSTYAQSPVTFKIQLKTDKGEPVDLSEYSKILFAMKEDVESNNTCLEKEVQVLQSSEGIFKIELSKTDLPFAGLWDAAIILYKGEDILTQYNLYLELRKGLKYSATNSPIEIAELRMFMMDRCPEDNDLIDDYEFSDSEMINALRWTIDLWNETRPVIAKALFTPATFPYRYYHMIGAAAQLMKVKGRNLLRNRLPFSTGSAQVDDKARGQLYMQLAAELSGEYKQWMRGEKHRINVSSCYSTQISTHFGY